MSTIHYHPLDPVIQQNPYPVYARLRAEAPIYRVPGLGLSAISRHEDVLTILKDPIRFSSRAMHDLFSGGVSALGDEHSIDAETLLGTDPPLHTRLRKIVNRGFTPGRIAVLEGRIRALSGELIAAFARKGACELLSELAIPLPVSIIADILGVAAEDRRHFKRWSDDFLVMATGQPTPDQRASIHRTDEEIGAWIDGVVAERQAAPRDDMISSLVAAEENEDVMSPEQVRIMIIVFLIAGNETTTNLIANSMLALLEHPHWLDALAKRPALSASATEELVRYTSPVQLTLRRATRDAELPSGKVEAGETLALLIASANRDERRFADPDRLDLERDARGHVGFGFGTHFCVGANLARLEARIALETLLGQLRGIRRVEEDLEFTSSLIVRGPRRLMLEWNA